VFFSGYVYDEVIPVFPESGPENWNLQKITDSEAAVLLVAGIVSPEPIVEYLSTYTKDIKTLFFGDHYAFQPKDFSLIQNEFDSIAATEKMLLVTEKDAARLVSNPNFPESLKSRTFALPIRVEILHDQETLFIQKIKSYVVEDSRNR
jgi:tetraacyldisaccharide 4'-kinase